MLKCQALIKMQQRNWGINKINQEFRKQKSKLHLVKLDNIKYGNGTKKKNK